MFVNWHLEVDVKDIYYVVVKIVATCDTRGKDKK